MVASSRWSSVVTPLLVGAVGGATTADSIVGWYAGLVKPAWNPPSWLFGPVWLTLSCRWGLLRGASGAVALLRTLRLHRSPWSARALVAYVVQLVLGTLWPPVLFGLRRTDLALVIVVLILGAIAETVRRFSELDRPAAALRLPYLAWVSFATVLNASIWLLNR